MINRLSLIYINGVRYRSGELCIDVKEASNLYRVSTRTINRWIKRGLLIPTELGIQGGSPSLFRLIDLPESIKKNSKESYLTKKVISLQEQLLNSKQVATHYGIDVSTVHRWVKSGFIVPFDMSKRSLQFQFKSLPEISKCQRGKINLIKSSQTD